MTILALDFTKSKIGYKLMISCLKTIFDSFGDFGFNIQLLSILLAALCIYKACKILKNGLMTLWMPRCRLYCHHSSYSIAIHLLQTVFHSSSCCYRSSSWRCCCFVNHIIFLDIESEKKSIDGMQRRIENSREENTDRPKGKSIGVCNSETPAFCTVVQSFEGK